MRIVAAIVFPVGAIPLVLLLRRRKALKRSGWLAVLLFASLVGVSIGLAEDLGVLNVIEGGGHDLAFLRLEPDRLEGALAQVDAPYAGYVCCHGVSL